MESVYLKTLVEVVRTGSISRAADILCVTQPAVSRRIRFLEDQYGCPLLDRTGRRLVPTDAGRLVCQKARALLEIEADLVAGLSVMSSRAKVVFGSTPAFGSAHLPAILRQFMLTCGDSADFKFMSQTPEQLLQGLTEGVFDAAVMENCERADLSPFTWFALPDGEVLFFSAPSLGILRSDLTLDDLVERPLLTRPDGCCSRRLLDVSLSAVGRTVQDFDRVVVLDDLHLVIQSVLQGGGVAFLSRDVVAEDLAAGRLHAHRVAGFQHSRRRALVLDRADWRDGVLRHFAAAVLGRFNLAVSDDLLQSRSAGAERVGAAADRAAAP